MTEKRRAKETQQRLLALLTRIEELLGDVRDTVEREPLSSETKVTNADGE